METTIVKVNNLSGFKASFESLCRKARKAGWTEPTYEILSHETKTVYFHSEQWNERVTIHKYSMSPNTEFSVPRLVDIATIKVTYETLVFKGWSFLGKISPIELDGKREFLLIGDNLPRELVKYGDCCQHCNTTRKRNSVFAIKNESGDILCVGSTCIKDFIDGHDAGDVAQAFDFFAEFVTVIRDTMEMNASRGVHGFNLPMFYDLAKQNIAKNGYFASDSSNPTKNSTRWIYQDTKEWEISASAAADIELAKQMNADETFVESLSNFDRNVVKLLCTTFILESEIGIAAYAPKAMEKLKLKYEAYLHPELSTEKVSNYVGEKKQRITVRVKVTNIFTGTGDFGIYKIVACEDEAGNKFKLSSFGNEEDPIGKWFDVTATVKNHKEYKGVKQTELLRPNIKEVS